MAGTQTVYLVSCVSKKGSSPAPAKDLYASEWFRRVRHFIENKGSPWFILSAKYGLVLSNQTLDPYDLTLNKMSIADRHAWADRVKLQMDREFRSYHTIVVFAGLGYRKLLMDYLKKRWTVEIPLEGLGIGKQLQWLAHHVAIESTR
jgi:hypothetical protein